MKTGKKDAKMCRFIGIDDLVANALIELIEANKAQRVSLYQIKQYADAVIELLKTEENENVVAIYTRDRKNSFLRDYTDFFEIIDDDGEEFIALKTEKTTDDLWRHFRSTLTIHWIIAFKKAAREVFDIAA